MKPIVWDEKRANRELRERLQDAMKKREIFEGNWRRNEDTLLNLDGGPVNGQVALSIPGLEDVRGEDITTTDLTVGVNYVFKHYRFLHAQLSANPPRVRAIPTSSDPTDKKKANAGDMIVRHAARTENMQERVDQATSKTLLYGTGWIKSFFDKNDGEIVDRDEETGEFELSGKISLSSPSTWNIYIDHRAKSWDDVRYVFEKYQMPMEEALMMFGEDKEEVLKQSITNTRKYTDRNEDVDYNEQVVEVFEYWEKGLPVNAMLGRHCFCTADGKPLTPVKPSPFRFSPPLQKNETEEDRQPAVAGLPFHVLTDIDIPDEVYGGSFIDYEAPIQDVINRLDTAHLDAVAAHSVCRMVLPETAEIMEDSVANTNYDVIKITGNQGPHFVSPPSLMPESSQLRDRLQGGGEDMAGVNESMFGQQSRETSGFSMQYATNQGNMIRRRLFNKYQMFVESVYRAYLNLVRKHWDDYHIVQVLGAEGAFDTMAFRGADIDGGFDLNVQYGGFSLDPDTRREQIMQLKPLFQEAGIDTQTILSMMDITDLDQLYDILELSAKRQEEIFQEMLSTKAYIKPRELQEHKGMLKYAYRFIMTSEFNLLDEADKRLIEQHIKEREAMAAQAPGAAGAPAAGGPLDALAMPGAGPAGMGGPAPIGQLPQAL